MVKHTTENELKEKSEKHQLICIYKNNHMSEAEQIVAFDLFLCGRGVFVWKIGFGMLAIRTQYSIFFFFFISIDH